MTPRPKERAVPAEPTDWTEWDEALVRALRALRDARARADSAYVRAQRDVPPAASSSS